MPAGLSIRAIRIATDEKATVLGLLCIPQCNTNRVKVNAIGSIYAIQSVQALSPLP